MFFAPAVRTRAAMPPRAALDRSFERFVNDAFFSTAHGGFKSNRTTRPGPSPWTCPASPVRT